jgi:hypothetical protein
LSFRDRSDVTTELKQISLEAGGDHGPEPFGGSIALEVTLEDGLKPETQKELLDWFRHTPVRMPRTHAELFRLLANFHPRIGWDTFAETIDFNGVTPRQIYQVVLGRHPETIEQAVGAPNHDPRRHFREVLVSREFRQRFLGAFLRAHSSKGRDVFIHVPKCAGTDLILNLGVRSVPMPKMLEIDGWTGDSEFLEIVAGLARAALTHERLFVYGHMELGEYIDTAGIRPDDRIFTVLRDPIDLMVSQANYAIGRVRQDPLGREPDAAEYLRLLGLTCLPSVISVGELKNLTLKALLNPLITEPNRACFFLGRGSQAVFATALENLIIHDVEITTTKNYDRWLRERWDIGQSSHHNRSDPILPNIEARRTCGAILAGASTEDRKLYDLVSWALQQAGTASIKGHTLARLIGPPLTEALRANTCPVTAPASREEQSILVAESAGYVEMYLSPVSIGVPGGPRIETVLSTGFGKEADGDRYRLDGWAASEQGFTWTEGERSSIRLPVLSGEGSFIIRFVATPFTVAQLRPFQQVELLIGEVRVGGCEVKDIAVIEAEVPPEVLRDGEALTITLRLPTAARPSELVKSKDNRRLALAVRSLTILRIPPASA